MRFVKLEPGKVAAKATVYSLPSQADYAEYITGQVTADKEGTLTVEETFNLPVFPGTLINEFLGIVAPAKTEPTPVERFDQTNITFTPTSRYTEAEEEIKRQHKEAKEQEEKFIEEWMDEATWSACTWNELTETVKAPVTQAQAIFKVEAKKPLSFNCYAGGPFWRISFESHEETKEVKIFARAFERGKV